MGSCFGKKMDEAQITDALKEGKKPVIWVIGGPGSGKGTQCIRLAEKYKMAHLSTGDLLRAEVRQATALGLEVDSLMRNGGLVAREIVLKLLKDAMIQAYPKVHGFLIDGYPRESIQGKDFEEQIGPCKLVLYLSCPDEVMADRLLKRAEGRADDNLETITKRIQIFHDVSEEVIKDYDSIVLVVSADQDADAVFNGCCACVDKFV